METLEDFKNAFFYGKRKDLLFKFLKNLPPEEAGAFLQAVLRELGASLDTNRLDALHELVFETQLRAYQPKADAKPRWAYDDAPFAPLTKPLSECRVGLLASSGHFVEGHDPNPFGIEGLTQDEAEDRIADFLSDAPALCEIPVDTPREKVHVRHPGYDVRGARADLNVTLPIDAMKDAAEEGIIGELHATAYSFVGAASQLRIKNDLISGWLERFRDAELDAMVLVPV